MQSLPSLLFLVASGLLCFTGPAAADDAAKFEEALAEPVSLKFDANSLELSLKSLAELVSKRHSSFAIKILGKDLELEGLTRNQSIRNYEATDKPAAEILTELVTKGDLSAVSKDPADPKLRLVWIVAADPDNSEKLAVLITTRAAVKKRGDKLPKVFQPKDK
jgi:hypothetical protein